MAATESGNPVPWILHNDSTVAHDDLPKLFGKQAPVVYFIDKSGEYGDLNIISLSIHKWPIQDENGNLTFNICIQEELDGFHYVCFSDITVDSNYRLICETKYDKYNDGFEIGWDRCYTFIRYLAGCPDWHDLVAAGVVE